MGVSLDKAKAVRNRDENLNEGALARNLQQYLAKNLGARKWRT